MNNRSYDRRQKRRYTSEHFRPLRKCETRMRKTRKTRKTRMFLLLTALIAVGLGIIVFSSKMESWAMMPSKDNNVIHEKAVIAERERRDKLHVNEIMAVKSNKIVNNVPEKEDKPANDVKDFSIKNKSIKKNSVFDDIYYFEEDKSDRYEAYLAKNPGMPPDEVVWKVNSFLDYNFYEHDIEADLNDPYIIVNKYYFTPEDYEPDDLIKGSDGYYMSTGTDAAFCAMQADASREGKKIKITSAYRSYKYQKGLYDRYLSEDTFENVETYSARAGHSEHHTGFAIDIVGSFGSLGDFADTKEYDWVYENAYKYGFIIRYTADNESITGYQSEPWHLRYIGVEKATDMKQKGIGSFEEYKVKYIDHNPKED